MHTRLVSDPVNFTTTATISRGRLVYAKGASVAIGEGRSLVLLSEPRALHHGHYTLTVRSRHGQRWITRRMTITIG